MRTPILLSIVLVTITAIGCEKTPSTPPPVITPDSAPGPDDRVENPVYTRWASTEIGTVVVYNEVTDVGGVVTHGRRAHKLVSRNEDVAEVESQDVDPETGKPIGTPQTLKHMRWMIKPSGKGANDPGRPAGTYETGEDLLMIKEKTYQTRWYKAKGQVEAGPTDTQTWYASEVPGGLVKSVHAIPNAKKSVTTELDEVRLP